jgi:hypothetical protein
MRSSRRRGPLAATACRLDHCVMARRVDGCSRARGGGRQSRHPPARVPNENARGPDLTPRMNRLHPARRPVRSDVSDGPTAERRAHSGSGRVDARLSRTTLADGGLSSGTARAAIACSPRQRALPRAALACSPRHGALPGRAFGTNIGPRAANSPEFGLARPEFGVERAHHAARSSAFDEWSPDFGDAIVCRRAGVL